MFVYHLISEGNLKVIISVEKLKVLKFVIIIYFLDLWRKFFKLWNFTNLIMLMTLFLKKYNVINALIHFHYIYFRSMRILHTLIFGILNVDLLGVRESIQSK